MPRALAQRGGGRGVWVAVFSVDTSKSFYPIPPFTQTQSNLIRLPNQLPNQLPSHRSKPWRSGSGTAASSSASACPRPRRCMYVLYYIWWHQHIFIHNYYYICLHIYPYIPSRTSLPTNRPTTHRRKRTLSWPRPFTPMASSPLPTKPAAAPRSSSRRPLPPPVMTAVGRRR